MSSPFLPSGPHFLRAILLENNDLRRRRPYGRAQDGPFLPLKDEVHERNFRPTLTYPRYC